MEDIVGLVDAASGAQGAQPEAANLVTTRSADADQEQPGPIGGADDLVAIEHDRGVGLDSDPAPPFVKLPSGEQTAAMAKLDAGMASLDVQRKALLQSIDPTLDTAQAEWERRVLNDERENPPVKLSDWHAIGPFAAGS